MNNDDSKGSCQIPGETAKACKERKPSHAECVDKAAWGSFMHDVCHATPKAKIQKNDFLTPARIDAISGYMLEVNMDSFFFNHRKESHSIHGLFLRSCGDSHSRMIAVPYFEVGNFMLC